MCLKKLICEISNCSENSTKKTFVLKSKIHVATDFWFLSTTVSTVATENKSDKKLTFELQCKT